MQRDIDESGMWFEEDDGQLNRALTILDLQALKASRYTQVILMA